MKASANLYQNCCCWSACLKVSTYLDAQIFMALRLMETLSTMVMLLVAIVAMLVIEPHLAEATSGFLGRDGYGPDRRNGGNSEEHRDRSSNLTGNNGIHNGGVSNGSGNGSSKHVGGNMHVGRINKGRIYDRGHKRSTTYAHPGSKPGLRNTTGNKGGKGGRIINIGRKRNPRGHIPVGSNIHIRNNGTAGGHQGPYIIPGIVHNHPIQGPEKRNQTYFGVRNRDGNRNGNGGHTFVGRNGGGKRRINHSGLNKTRGNGGHQISIGGNGSGSGSDHSGGKTPGVSNGGDKGDNKVGNPGDSSKDHHSGNISAHVGEGGNVSAGNATGRLFLCKPKLWQFLVVFI